MNFKQQTKKAFRESRNHNFTSKLSAYILVPLIQNYRFHKLAFILSGFFNKIGFSISEYYLGELNFLYGDFEKAKVLLENYLNKVYNPDALYLLSNIYALEKNKDKSFEILEKTLNKSSRVKTWLILANFVDSDESFNKFNDLIRKYEKKFIKDKNQIKEYSLIAAARSRNYLFAKKILINQVKEYFETKKIIQVTKKSFSPNAAAEALKDIKETLIKEKIEIFLVSGTFLGCIREGKILGHDQDVDVGVLNDYSYDELAYVIQKSGKFILHEPLSKNILKAKHLNGTLVDVFIHYENNGLLYHEGVKTRWFNKAFDLIEYDFLGDKYLGAKDFDTYLTENYGDWRVPNKDFDYVLDTTNMEVISEDEYILHLYKLLLKPYGIKNKNKILNKLSELKELELRNYLTKDKND